MIAASSASAFERQHHFGLDGGVGMLKVGGKDSLSVGGGGGLHYTYGMTDAFDLMVEGCFMQVALEELPAKGIQSNRPTSFSNAGVGVSYVLDVLRFVPYFGILLGGYRLSGGTLDSALVLPGASLAVGLDYQINRHWAVGLGGRQALLLTKASTYPSYTTVMMRLEYMWGF